MDPISQLKAAIDRALNVTLEQEPVPPMLNEENERLKRLLGGAGGGGPPPGDRMRKAVISFKVHHELPTLWMHELFVMGRPSNSAVLRRPSLKRAIHFRFSWNYLSTFVQTRGNSVVALPASYTLTLPMTGNIRSPAI